MSDNARFHSKLHRKNHHSVSTPGYPDSATDPIASADEPFQGDFYLNGNLNIAGAISTVFSTLSNISIPVPVLSAGIGFNPSTSLIVQLSGNKYAIPVTYVGTNTITTPNTGINSLSSFITYVNGLYIYGSLSGSDSINWNNITSFVIANSASWSGGYNVFTLVEAESGFWNNTYSVVATNSANWSSNQSVNTYVATASSTFDASYNLATYAKLSAQPYTYNFDTISIQSNNTSNNASGNYSGTLGGISNTSSGYGSIIAGGSTNTSSGRYSIIAGGAGNNVYADYSGALGTNNTLSGACSYAVGNNLVSNVPNYTFVNNISSQGYVCGLNTYACFLNVSPIDSVVSTLANVRAQFFSNNDSFAQINHQNICSGSNASTDYIVTSDNGNDNTNYLDIGINSSTYSSTAYSITGPNDAYIYAQSKNLTIGTASCADLILHTCGTTVSNERVRITSSGYVGIGTCTPNTILTVVGDISATGNAYFCNTLYCAGAGVSSIVPYNGTNTASNIYANIGGGTNNIVTGIGSVIGGGYSNQILSNYTGILGGCSNSITGPNAVIGGGSNNRINSDYGSVLGGDCNCARYFSGIIGGQFNNADGNYSLIGGGKNNTASGVYGVITGGFNNCNLGDYSYIGGGSNNSIASNVCNSFVLGSNINAGGSNQTYVNNLYTDGTITAGIINANTGICSNDYISSPNLSAFCGSFYNTFTWDSVIQRSNVIGGDLTVLGNIYSPYFSSLSGTGSFVLSGGNKYSTVFGNGALSSFTINHNLSTTDIVMTVVDISNSQVVYPSITITDINNIQVSFSFVPPSLSYKISIIGL